MSEHSEQNGMPDGELERLLKDAPEPPRMEPSRKEAVWLALEAQLSEVVTPQAAKPRRWRQLALAAAAAILVLSLPLWLTLRSDGTLGHVAEVHGAGYSEFGERGRAILAQGDAIAAGQRIQVGPGNGVKLALVDGTTLWLCENTQVVCVGPRSAKGPVLRLIEGEVRAEVTPGPPEEAFSIETPAATLRVLGTRFNCKLYAGSTSAPAAQSSEDSNMIKLRAALRSALILTVLSGAVEVHANNATQTVEAGSRGIVVAQQATTTQEPLGSSNYSAKWLGDPGPSDPPEALVFRPIRDMFLYAMWAVDVQTGKAREVTDFITVAPNVVAQFGSNLALVNASSVLFPHFSNDPVGGAGRPFINDALYLVNLDTGEKMPMTPLVDYDPLYMELSPDRRKLAFVGSHVPDKSKPRDKEGGIFVLDLETLTVNRVFEGWLKTCPHWSPDSRWLAVADAEGYVSGNEYDIVLIDTVAQSVVRTGLNGAGIRFTPDGESIVYSSGFKRDGSWSAGVPTYGNLFIAALRDLKPEQLTMLPEGGAINPSFSPDGTSLMYWAASTDDKKPAALHRMDVPTRADKVLLEGDAYSQITWLDEGSRFLLASRENPTKPATFLRVDVRGYASDVGVFTPEVPDLSEDVKAAQSKSADDLLEAFVLYRQAVDAQDLHRVDDAVVKYREARDVLSQWLTVRGYPVRPIGLLLTPEDFRPYVEAFSEFADLDAAGLSVNIVRENMEAYAASMLNSYYKKEKSFPTDLPACVKEVLGMSWQINHIRSSDSERAKRLFVVPGDDPDKVITSYEVVSNDASKPELVLRTPVLANGKRLQATYTVEEGKWVRATIEETE